MVPYLFHGDRASQFFNPYWVVHKLISRVGSWNDWKSVVDLSFLLGQLSICAIVLVKRIRTEVEVYQYSVLAIVLFITFAKIDSPQWLVWYVPIVLMFARRDATLIAVALLTVANYVFFPITYDNVGPFLAARGLAHVPVSQCRGAR